MSENKEKQTENTENAERLRKVITILNGSELEFCKKAVEALSNNDLDFQDKISALEQLTHLRKMYENKQEKEININESSHFLITDLDNEINSEQLSEIANKNKDNSVARSQYRTIMERLRYQASFGYNALHLFEKTQLEPRVITYLQSRGGFEVDFRIVPDSTNADKVVFEYRISFEDAETKKKRWEDLNAKDKENEEKYKSMRVDNPNNPPFPSFEEQNEISKIVADKVRLNIIQK